MWGSETSEIVAVVIPYYQRTAESCSAPCCPVMEQDLPHDVRVFCVIVDDGSPHPAEGELPVLENDSRVNFHVVCQVNAGVSAARNTALDHIPAGTRYVAYLDSDDVWNPDHLARAIAAMHNGADLYFSDCALGLGRRLVCFDAGLSEAAIRSVRRGLATGSSVSSPRACCTLSWRIVQRIPPPWYIDLRLIPTLASTWLWRSSGEDHLFWFDLVRTGALIAVDTHITASRGHGVDLYRSAQNWNSPGCIARLCGNLLKYIRLKDRVPAALINDVRQQLDCVRQELLLVMARSLRTYPGQVANASAFLWRHDKGFFATAFINTAKLVRRKRTTGRYV